MGKVALIELSEGNRYIRPVKIRSEVYDISAEDWQKICNEWPEKFEYVGKFVKRATHENSSIGYSVCDKSVPAPDKAT
jgi:hypothetical protein